MKNRVMVTGANGFLGSRLVSFYQKCYEVLPVSHGSLDLTDRRQVLECLKAHTPDTVLHCAAISDTGICEMNPQLSHEVNVEGTKNLADACSLTGSRLVFMSSDQIYSESRSMLPHREEEKTVCSRIYARDKRQAEAYITDCLPDAVCLRLPWMYDLPSREYKVNNNFLCQIVQTLIKNEPMNASVYDYRGITWVWETASLMEKAWDLPGGIYNFGSESSGSVYETALELIELLAPERKALIHKDQERYQEAPRNLAMNTSRLQDNGIHFHDTSEGFACCLKAYHIL